MARITNPQARILNAAVANNGDIDTAQITRQSLTALLRNGFVEKTGIFKARITDAGREALDRHNSKPARKARTTRRTPAAPKITTAQVKTLDTIISNGGEIENAAAPGVYTSAFSALIRNGLIEQDADTLRITDAGRKTHADLTTGKTLVKRGFNFTEGDALDAKAAAAVVKASASRGAEVTICDDMVWVGGYVADSDALATLYRIHEAWADGYVPDADTIALLEMIGRR